MNSNSSPTSPHAGQQISSMVFKYLLGGSALFIAACSAFFSVCGLGLLFIGSATAVMVMATSLELGKLVAASFLYRYWSRISTPLRIYLMLAVVILIAITSLGNYGYLVRAYESTHTKITGLEQQIPPLQQEIEITQGQIEAERNQIDKTTDGEKESHIAQVGRDLEQSLTRLEERRKAAKERQDQDSQTLSTRLIDTAELLKKDLATEDEATTKLNERIALLNRAVEIYTDHAQFGSDLFNLLLLKSDGVRKGQDLYHEQEPERKAIASDIASHQQKRDQLRADFAKTTEAIQQSLTAVQTQYRQELAGLDVEEQALRKSNTENVAKIEQQATALHAQEKIRHAESQHQIAVLDQRIAADTLAITNLRQQMAATDIGSYRFVARALNAPSDDIVKWLVLLLVMVFDPLAVMLMVGFNIALGRERRVNDIHSPMATEPKTTTHTENIEPDKLTNQSFRPTSPVIWLVLLVLTAGLTIGAGYYGPNWLKQWQQRDSQHAIISQIPGDSFCVLGLHPNELPGATDNIAWKNVVWNNTLGNLVGKPVLSQLTDLFGTGLDTGSDVYAFVKYPTQSHVAQTQNPVMICGFVARIKDSATAEAGLNRFADALSDSLHHGNNTHPLRRHDMVRYGSGRYLEPQGDCISYALTDHQAIVMIEIHGDPTCSTIESEIRLALSPTTTDTTISRSVLPKRALAVNAVLSLWFDANRCFTDMPKNSAAQNRYQQLANRLNFDLLLTGNSLAPGQLQLVADYNYAGIRFGSQTQSPLSDILGNLGPVASAGVSGQLIDSCALTLDIEALEHHLPMMLSDPHSPTDQVRVEKTITSPQAGRLELITQYDPHGIGPFETAFRNLVR